MYLTLFRRFGRAPIYQSLPPLLTMFLIITANACDTKTEKITPLVEIVFNCSGLSYLNPRRM